MKIIRDLDELEVVAKPISLTIGNFDGVHIGHQFLLQTLIHSAKKNNGQSVVATFENHPKTLLNKAQSHYSITTLSHKLKLLKQLGIDGVLLLQFTEAFREQTAEEFLTQLHSKLPFSELILGEDARFGKDRQGTQENIYAIAKKLNIEPLYLQQLQTNQKTISSTLLRELIEKGDFISVEKLLGRKYSVYGEVIKGPSKTKLNVSGLILPPSGTYNVTSIHENKSQKAIANLGPTLMEVHLPEISEDFYGKELEVVFESNQGVSPLN